MSKERFRKVVSDGIEKAAFHFLTKKKNAHSKLIEINYSKLKVQDYIKTDNILTDEEKCILFKFRVREMDVRLNYKNKYSDHLCQLCYKEADCFVMNSLKGVKNSKITLT